ncbi:hypothetical protein QR680_002141 [Steinernema hermaphroditum]|uniref:Major facilitator superfamily (MFS) profile domain-containing protein n=1 Tax=Steinernema hermaphroditum TaxID=289476 RepID=A0AA39H486_9BILA|nr:hypothetical protein QR680_002141 [Steinernema hermaphroditum]
MKFKVLLVLVILALLAVSFSEAGKNRRKHKHRHNSDDSQEDSELQEKHGSAREEQDRKEKTERDRYHRHRRQETLNKATELNDGTRHELPSAKHQPSGNGTVKNKIHFIGIRTLFRCAVFVELSITTKIVDIITKFLERTSSGGILNMRRHGKVHPDGTRVRRSLNPHMRLGYPLRHLNPEYRQSNSEHPDSTNSLSPHMRLGYPLRHLNPENAVHGGQEHAHDNSLSPHMRLGYPLRHLNTDYQQQNGQEGHRDFKPAVFDRIMSEKKVHPGKVYEHRTRYFILFLGMFCLSSICSNMISLNFTLICMNEKSPEGVPQAISPNTTENSLLNLDISNLSVVPGPEGETVHQFDYTQKEKSMLLWAVAIGTLLAAFPFNYLYQCYGAKYVFFVAGILSAAATAAIPTMAYWSLNWFLFARFLQESINLLKNLNLPKRLIGISYGADFAAIGLITVRWASLKQHGVFISVLTSFSLVSVIVTMPVSGFLCENYGWPSVYYAHASFGVFIFTLWIICYKDDPRKHRAVSAIELEKIERNKSEAHKNHDPYVPYWAIIKNPVILTVWLNAFAEILSSQLLVTYGPTYLKEVLKFGVARTGTYVAIPVVVQMACKLSSGYLSDQLKFASERSKMIFFNTIALMLSGLFYGYLGFVPQDKPMQAVFVIGCVTCCLGFNCGGFYKCGTLVARQYSHFVISNIQFIKCLSLFIGPLLVAIFVPDSDSQIEWRTVFIMHAAALILGNVAFCFAATDQPAYFTTLTGPQNKVAPAAVEAKESKTKDITPV